MTSTTTTVVEKPRRKHHSKARTGCITCKIRRVKCDETKPFCVRCTSTGRKCDGYGDSTTKSFNARLPITGPPSSLFSTSQEAESFQFFCEKTVGVVGACSPTLFWDKHVLPLCHSSPTIKNLVLSLASYHQTILQPGREVGNQQTFYLNHYNMALRQIINGQDTNVGNVLVACLCLTACDDFSGRTLSSLHHATAAFRILAAYQAREPHLKDSASDEIIQDVIYPVLAYLQKQTSPFLNPGSTDPEPQTSDISFDMKTTRVVHLPSRYNSLAEARHYLDKVVQARLSDFLEPHTSQGKILDMSKFSQELAHWLSVLDDYLSDPVTRLNADDALTQLMLRNHHLAIGLLVRMNASFDEMRFDDIGLFESITYKVQPTVERYLEYVRSHSIGSVKEGYKEEDFGFIPPLFFCATRCRTPRTRRSALQMLYRLQRYEGDWSSFMAAKIAETIMNIEESSASSSSPSSPSSSSPSSSSSSPGSAVRTTSDVLRSARIRAVAVDINASTKQAILTYARWPYDQDQEDVKAIIQGWRNDDDRNPRLLSQQLTKLVRAHGYQGLVQSRPMNPSASRRDNASTSSSSSSSSSSPGTSLLEKRPRQHSRRTSSKTLPVRPGSR